MNARFLPGKDYNALRAASRRAVDLAGGPVAVTAITRGSQSRISEAISANHDERFLAIDQVADIESDIGRPVITETLAALAGYRLIRIDAERDELSVANLLREVIAKSGHVTAEAAEAFTAKEISPRELKALADTFDDCVQSLQAARDKINGL